MQIWIKKFRVCKTKKLHEYLNDLFKDDIVYIRST